MNLKHLEALMEQATPLPWTEGISSHHTVSKAPKFFDYRVAEFHHARDAELVDAAVNALPELIATLREAREALEYGTKRMEAYKERDLNCGCDHNEYCEKCLPVEFRKGGRFYEMPDMVMRKAIANLRALEGE